MSHLDCPETYSGIHGLSDVHGHCPFCRRRVEPPLPRPDHLPISDLTDAYEQFYDPDWGRA